MLTTDERCQLLGAVDNKRFRLYHHLVSAFVVTTRSMMFLKMKCGDMNTLTNERCIANEL